MILTTMISLTHVENVIDKSLTLVSLVYLYFTSKVLLRTNPASDRIMYNNS